MALALRTTVFEPVRPTRATYRRRRAVAGTITVLIVTGAAQLGTSVLSGPGGVPASATGAATATVARHVRAERGDSMWSIAERFRGDVGVQRYVEALIDLNGGTAITAGQLVRLP